MTLEAERTDLEASLAAEHERYHRQSLISWWDQERLATATAIVVGAGALGNELVKNLALVGIGRIVVVDLDVIEGSNLARCVFFRPEDEGRAKAEVLATRARDLNEDVNVVSAVGDVRSTLGLGAFADADVVLGGLDNREARLFVNQACWKAGTPWVDGAIEGLMGVVRVFDPPDSACYECTMSDRDRELLAARRTCALLTREEMALGKVPTTATSASVVAGMQVQEAVKLLHRDRLGPPALAGAGFHFVGLTHDSYVVRYPRDEDCLSHDTYGLDDAEPAGMDEPFGAFLARTREKLGAGAVLELEHELLLELACHGCDRVESVLKPVHAVSAEDAVCPTCGQERTPTFAHAVEDDAEALARCSAAEVGLPPGDVLVGRVGLERTFYRLDGALTAGGRDR